MKSNEERAKKKYIVSLCMAGENCRYDGSNKFNNVIKRLIDEGRAFPLCPELLGGLSTPREPAEYVKQNGKTKVLTKSGVDQTAEFQRGAQAVLDFAKANNITSAILYHNSPSCGKVTYDGSFSGKLANYSGVTAQLLQDNGIEVISSDDLVEIENL